jgi:hypothetical protein
MASMSETGHAKNVANFKELITVVRSFEGQYQPIAEVLQINALEKQAANAGEVLSKLKELETLSKQATATLQEEFKTLSTFSSQLMGVLISSGAKTSSVEEAKAVQKRIAGTNSRKKRTEMKDSFLGETKDFRSTSRQSYDSRLDDFEKLISILQNIPEYRPKEDLFQVVTLQSKAKNMKNAIQENDSRDIARKQVMHERNALLYTPESGVVAIASKIKAYIKGVFGGVKSTQYKSVSKIKIAGSVKS